jgi:hypothetical protein
MHCESCKKTIGKMLAYEKGVNHLTLISIWKRLPSNMTLPKQMPTN